MSLNNIELKDILIGELYRDHLLATEGKPTAAPPSATPPPAASTGVPTAPVSPSPTSAKTTPPAPSAAPVIPSPTASAPPPPPAKTPSQPPVPPVLPSSATAATTAAPSSQPAAQVTPPAFQAQDPTLPTIQSPTGGLSLYRTLGNHRRKITILVNTPGIAFLPDDQLAFLTKMLEACKMNMGDVAIINHATLPVDISMLKQQLNPSFVLLFGLEPTTIRLPLNFPLFKIQAYDQTTYLSSSSLEELIRPGEDSKLLKSKLWVSLKTLFGI